MRARTRAATRLWRSAPDRPTGELATEVRELVSTREQVGGEPGRGDHGTGVLLGAGAIATAVAFAVLGDRPQPAELALAAALVLLYALGCRVEIVLPGGAAVPTQPVLVGLLLSVPPSLVPLAVLAGLHLAEVGQLLHPPARPRDRILGPVVRSLPAWSCVAPVALLWVAGPPQPSPGRIGLYTLCLLAQAALDAVVALVRARALGLRLGAVLASLLWTFGIDAMLAPVGLCVVLAARATSSPWLLLALAAPTGLVWLMAQDRAHQLRTAVTLGVAFDAAREQALVDPLTGLGNRRAWEEALDARAAAAGAVVVLMADVDGLKRVNDTVGHDAGDSLLRAVAHVLLTSVPPGALVARLGGDEFGVLVPLQGPADLTGADLVEHVRARLAVAPTVHGEVLSCSLGWASSPDGRDLAAVAREADSRAGEDKASRRAGRDEVRAT